MSHTALLQRHAFFKNNRQTTMKKWLLLPIAFAFFTNTYAQMSAVIVSENGNEICAGFTPANCAHVALMTPPPLPLPENSILVYTWTAEHSNGNWTWHTNYPTRIVPLPFTGTYKIQVKIEYMRKGTKRPYAAFWSNKLFVQGMGCP